MSQLSVKDVPQDNSKPQDIYSVITKMNATLSLEEETKRKKEQIARQHAYREELEKQLRDKQQSKNYEQREDNIWLNQEKNAMDR